MNGILYIVKNKQVKGTMTTKFDIKNDLNFSLEQ